MAAEQNAALDRLQPRFNVRASSQAKLFVHAKIPYEKLLFKITDKVVAFVILKNMKRKLLAFAALSIISGLSFWLVPKWQREHRPFRTPTQEQLSKAFPNNTRAIFENSEQFIIYSLEPMPADMVLNHKGEVLHGWPVLGKQQVIDAKIKAELIAAYYDGLTDTGFSAACFSPGHAIRTIKNGKSLDLVICFGCSHVKVIEGNTKKPDKYVHIGKYPQSTFDRIFADFGLPRSKRWKD